MSTDHQFGRTIQLFLVDGTPTGLRKATIHGWTGLMFVSGASAFGALTARPEVDRTGIYILSGPDPDQTGGTRVYIGSGNSASERIRQSALKRDFWETAIAVTTSDDDLSKGHAEYLESRLIKLTRDAGRTALDNVLDPQDTRRRLPEALLHKSDDDRSSPFPGHTYRRATVAGMPRAVKRFITAARI